MFILYILIANKLRNDWYQENKKYYFIYFFLLCHLIGSVLFWANCVHT